MSFEHEIPVLIKKLQWTNQIEIDPNKQNKTKTFSATEWAKLDSQIHIFFLGRIVPYLLTSFICERTSQLSHSVQHMWLQIVTFYCLWKMSAAVLCQTLVSGFLQEPVTWLNFTETLREVHDSFRWTMAQLWTKLYMKEGFLILFKAGINQMVWHPDMSDHEIRCRIWSYELTWATLSKEKSLFFCKLFSISNSLMQYILYLMDWSQYSVLVPCVRESDEICP